MELRVGRRKNVGFVIVCGNGWKWHAFNAVFLSTVGWNVADIQTFRIILKRRLRTVNVWNILGVLTTRFWANTIKVARKRIPSWIDKPWPSSLDLMSPQWDINFDLTTFQPWWCLLFLSPIQSYAKHTFNLAFFAALTTWMTLFNDWTKIPNQQRKCNIVGQSTYHHISIFGCDKSNNQNDFVASLYAHRRQFWLEKTFPWNLF